ncbi:Marine sediment metagenome DNA, contig: S12H4_L00851 (Fragment) OS=marine sediment metagenome GN=S12H4_14329 PE=4 SV=1: Methyltransf_24 [Gemmata massiliana]|uniref:Class I SAM-dependent methyltransferase n=1 Tax=Gemmata massiliana TaxID=1210884 RepID=A0A6P2D171_9BACT
MSRAPLTLDALAKAPRVWNNDSPENVTGGLIQLCRELIRSDWVMTEVGCFAGVSTAVFAHFARTVFAVDPWELGPARGYTEIPAQHIADAARRFDRVLEHFANVKKCQGFSTEVATGFADASLDGVYLDGAHDPANFEADVRAWAPKIKPGGWLMGHDLGLVGDPRRFLNSTANLRAYPESSWALQIG